jgi:tetrapyrrole methylase family protein / MazG family protein
MKKRSTLETAKLLQVVHELRTQCPWDKKQTHKTLLPYLLEEAYESAEAIREANPDSLREELGDLLLQIALHSEIASEKGWFTFEDVSRGIREKMVRRHPHVYAKEKALSKKAQSARWTQLKQSEKPKRKRLEGTPKSMPALMLAQRYGEIAASVGFDWKGVSGVFDKLAEEIKELRAEIRKPKKSKRRIQEELGDMLFCMANLARHLGVSAEEAGRVASLKFAKRFESIEAMLAKDSLEPASLSPQAWGKAWQRAKKSGSTTSLR